VREARARHERHLDAREPAFVEVVEAVERDGRDDGSEDAVAEELKALVRELDRLALRRRRMRDGRQEQLLVFEAVAAAGLRAVELAPLLVGERPVERKVDLASPCRLVRPVASAHHAAPPIGAFPGPSEEGAFATVRAMMPATSARAVRAVVSTPFLMASAFD